MQLHTLKRKTKNKRSYQIGRGGKHAKTGGRGTKGQNARAGRKKRPEMRDVIKRFPKLRGRGVNSLKSISSKPFPINLAILEERFSNGETVSPVILIEKGLVKTKGAKTPQVKILATGDLTKKLLVTDCLVSASARDKIVAAGGEVK